jgi:hypothetical protein
VRYGGKQTLYDALDLPRGVSSREVEEAYRRARSEMEKEGATADPRRLALLREAYEMLGDDRRRAAYDASLVADPVVPEPQPKVSPRTIALVAGIVGLAIAAFLVMRPRPSATAFRDELTELASVSVARLHAIEMGGRRSALAWATTVDEGVMATTCHGITPGMQLVVDNGTHALAATVAIADYAADICKLSVAGGASRPVTASMPPPRARDRLYVVVPRADGALALEDATVKGPVALANGAAIEIDRAIAPGEDGAAVFDAQGKLAGITTSAGSTADGRGVVLPAAWISAARARPAPRR